MLKLLSEVCQLFMTYRYWRLSVIVVLVVLFICCLYLLSLVGFIDRLNELPFSQFRYPRHINISEFIMDHKTNYKYKNIIINRFNHTFLTYPSFKCSQTQNNTFLIFLIKSKPDNIERRDAIRQTWANNETLDAKSTKRVFLMGNSRDNIINENVKNEAKKYKDILLIDFKDSYYNNTIKTFNGLRWFYEFCENVDFIMLVDDDFFVATTSLISYLKLTDINSPLLVGFANPYLQPVRCKICKWYIPISEYPFDKYPRYLSGGALLMTAVVAKSIFIASKVVKNFKLDDIYLAIIAHKLGIYPKHNDNIHIDKVSYRNRHFKNILASHGYSKREEFYLAWQCHMHNICNFQEGFGINFIVCCVLLTVIYLTCRKKIQNILRTLMKVFRKSSAALRI